MKTLSASLRRTLHGMGERGLANQRTLLDWQLAQVRLVEKQFVDTFALQRASMEIAGNALHGMARVMVDALAPQPPAGA
jgi:hypothetical protein